MGESCFLGLRNLPHLSLVRANSWHRKGGRWRWALPFPWALPCRQLLCLWSRPQTHRTAFASFWTDQWEIVGNELILLPWLLKFQWLHSRPKYLEVQMALFTEGLQVASSLRLFLLKLPTPLPHPQGNGDNIVYTNPGLAVPRKLTSSIQVAQSW